MLKIALVKASGGETAASHSPTAVLNSSFEKSVAFFCCTFFRRWSEKKKWVVVYSEHWQLRRQSESDHKFVSLRLNNRLQVNSNDKRESSTIIISLLLTCSSMNKRDGSNEQIIFPAPVLPNQFNSTKSMACTLCRLRLRTVCSRVLFFPLSSPHPPLYRCLLHNIRSCIQEQSSISAFLKRHFCPTFFFFFFF